jgi:membrane protein DedA with SNARE-associated domain
VSLGEITAATLEFVRLHPNWSAAVVFALAFGESLPFASLVLPFWALLVAVGTVIGAAAPFAFWSIVAAAAIGAALGDWLAYWLGFHYRERVAHMWPLSKYPKLLDRAQVLFSKYGAGAIALARFSGPLRATVPIVAGIACMPPLHFQLANWLSAFVWAVVLLSPGTWGLGWLVEHLK